jgi:putative Holliday junction resolvase
VTTVGIDYGKRRIGIAVSDSGVIATAHSTLSSDGSASAAVENIARLGGELGADRYVIGIPRTLRHDSARTEERFRLLAEALRQRTSREVVLWDEALTSVEAEASLRQRGHSAKEIRARVDMEAARIILQSYLDEHGRRAS